MMPLITYITVVRNAVNDIDDTIGSVIPFLSDQVEYIIVDGKSTDGTVEKIKAYEGKISKWVSEADKGIYDAMNTGLRMASGAFVCFINIGDRLLNCPIRQLEKALQQNVAAVSFPVALSNKQLFYPSFSGRIKLENTLHHQGTYYRKSMVKEYNLLFKTFSDFDMHQNLYKNGEAVVVDHSVINSYHDLNGVSHDKKKLYEIFKVVRKNYGVVYSVLSYFYFKIRYGLQPKIRSVFKQN
jgi:glycosyltransferase involved in cell wall biosynthesis